MNRLSGQSLKSSRGFTLVELLVVISIIGILSTFGMLSLNGAREKAYDALVKSDIANVRTSLYMCFDDMGGTYTGCKVPDRFKPPACTGDTAYHLTIDPSGGSSYISYGHLCAQKPYVFCADSTGFSGVVPLPGETQLKCVIQ